MIDTFWVQFATTFILVIIGHQKNTKYPKLKQKEYTNYAVLLVAEKWILVKETKS